MRSVTTSVCALVLLMSVSGLATAADEGAAGPRVGEVRALAIAPGSAEAIAQLHRDGWLEAKGQLVPTAALPTLFKSIGRAWTADGISSDQFAIPELYDRSQREALSSEDPFGVLGGVIDSGRRPERTAKSFPLSYWIFAGQDVTQLAANRTVARR